MQSFDAWSEVKCKIHITKANKKYHAGDIWWCNLGRNIGFEQNGKGALFERPVLVVKGFSLHVCLVVPLTTKRKNNRFHVSVGYVQDKEAFAILSQIRLVDTKRFSNQIGFIHSDTLIEIKKAICDIIIR